MLFDWLLKKETAKQPKETALLLDFDGTVATAASFVFRLDKNCKFGQTSAKKVIVPAIKEVFSMAQQKNWAVYIVSGNEKKRNLVVVEDGTFAR